MFDLEQHHTDDQRMTSKYSESDSKARGDVRSVGAEPSVLCRSHGASMSYMTKYVISNILE